MKTTTIKVVLEEVAWARRKNSGVLIIEDETMLDNIEKALEKQIPKKLKLKENGICVCPSCGEQYMYRQYCNCGQKLDMGSVR